MSGHSKWATIKRQKETLDHKRGQVFSKMTKLILVAAREGGTDPDGNFKLRLAIEKAKQANMPKENIKRALQSVESKTAGQLEEVVYEGYGPGGIAVVVETVTDSRNRTTAEIKNIFERGGGRLAGPAALAFLFKRSGLIMVAKETEAEKQILTLIDLGAADVEEKPEAILVFTPVDQLKAIAEKMVQAGFRILETEIIRQPLNLVPLADAEKGKVERFIKTLKEHEDVQKVYSN